jgi:cyclic pyranopterin phosphate synthase
MQTALLDTLSRPLRDLRISVTDRCNFRCVYCMPKEIYGKGYQFLAKDQLLTFEELARLATIFASLGTQKIRLTGGEPLMRRGLDALVGMLARIPDVELTLTTNGSLLAEQAPALAAAGLKRVTVSLDSLDGIDAAVAAGLSPVKINMVVRRGLNEQSILPMARYFREKGHILRFIEYMDVGHTNGWRLEDVVSAREIVRTIDAELALLPVEANYAGEVAERWRYADGSGEIGVIASVTQPFCAGCTRARLSADGGLYTCLFATTGRDLRSLVREGAGDDAIRDAIAETWTERADRYSEQRSSETAGLHKIEMSFIGG